MNDFSTPTERYIWTGVRSKFGKVDSITILANLLGIDVFFNGCQCQCPEQAQPGNE